MIVVNDSLEAHPSPQKIGSIHFQRLAVVYVRQSTAQQVLRHEESTRLQYGLVGRARQLGWPEERIVVIDDDLGSGDLSTGQVFEGLASALGDLRPLWHPDRRLGRHLRSGGLQ